MRAMWGWILAFGLSGCATLQMGRPAVSILVDLYPASTDRTVIVESLTADRQGQLVRKPAMKRGAQQLTECSR